MTPEKTHHARIMVEYGCTIEDVAVTLRVRLHDAVYAVAPSLKANPSERKKVQKMLLSMKMEAPVIPAAQRGRGLVDLVESLPVKLRAAA